MEIWVVRLGIQDGFFFNHYSEGVRSSTEKKGCGGQIRFQEVAGPFTVALIT